MKICYNSLILFYILISQYQNLCGQGCLQCSRDQQQVCQQCDKSLNYKLVNNSCQKILIENCAKYDSNFNCISCFNPFYLSQDQQECLESNLLINNCIQRSTEDFCFLCQENFYPNNGQCQPVLSFTNNCLFYGENQICQRCKDQYILSPYFKNCIEKPDQNCLMYDQVECIECKENFILKNKNNFDLLNISDIFKYQILEKNQFCEQLNSIDQNCQQQNLDGCEYCKQGYFLDNGICKEFGQSQSNVQIIENCVHYLNQTQCQNCANNYYPSNNRQLCLEKPINFNCQKIATDQYGPICLTCVQSQYLFQNQCFERQNYLINNCITYSNNEDKCSECQQNFEFDSSQTFCQPLNCLEYNTTLQQCIKCQNKFYLNNQTCILGTINNCLEYFIDQNQCQQCDYLLRYQLNEFGQCQQILPQIDNCSEQSQIENSCNQCNQESITLEINQICQQKDITNCIQYNQEGGCNLCQNNLVPSFDQLECIDQQYANCELISNNSCQKCAQGYHISNSQCIKIHPFLQQNCFQNSLQEANEMQLQDECQICEQNTFPIKSKSACLNQDFIKLQSYYIPYCISYLQETCIQCENNKFLNDQFQCIDQCANYQESYLIQLHGQNILLPNYCIQDNQCMIKSIPIDQRFQNEYQYYCQKCHEDFINVVINQNVNNSLINLQKTSSNNFQFTNFVVRVQCIEKSNSQIIQIIENCDFYGLIHPDTNQIGCLKCKFGFRDQQPIQFQKIQDNSKCSQFDPNNKCILCQDKYLLDDQGFCYRPRTYYENCLEQIPFCNNQYIQGFDTLDLHLFSCHQCQSNSLGESQYPVMSGFKSNNQIYNYSFQDNTMIKCMSLNQINNYQTQVDLNNCQYFRIVNQFQQEFMECAGVQQGYYNNSDDPNLFDILKLSNQFLISNQYGFPNLNLLTFQNRLQPTSDNIFKVNYLNKTNNVFIQSNSLQIIECEKGKESAFPLKCSTIQMPKCLITDQAFIYDNFEIDFVFIDMINNKSYGHGCTQCEDGLINVYGPITKQCHFVQIENPFDLFFSNFNVNNCKKYGFQNDIVKCQICNLNYKFNQDNNQCESYQYPQGCLELTLDQNSCSFCEQNYILLNGNCYEQNIQNCQKYDLQNNTLKCSQCVQDYYWNQQECILGNVQNCQQYTSEGMCEVCQIPYILLNNNCIQIQLSDDFNCDQFQINNNTQLQCSQCKDLYIQKLLDQSLFQCYFQEISNCEEYQNSVENLTFQCVQCQESKILINGNCQNERQIFIQYCNKYQAQEEKCEICQEGSQLTNGICQEPNLISNCIEYVQNTNQCNKCQDNFILSIDKLNCNERTLINNCQFYDSNYNCIECQINYFLNNNQCQEVSNIEFCQEYSKTQNKCILCEQNYHLNNDICENDNQNLQPISNCLYHEEISKCKQCNSQYYFNESTGNCELIDQPQQNCDLYDNQQQCIKCEEPSEFQIDENKNIYCKEPDYEGCLVGLDIQYFGVDQCQFCTQNYFHYKNKCYQNQETSFELCQTISTQSNEIDLSIYYQCINELNIFNCEKLGNQLGQCQKCKSGYILFNKNQCIKEQNQNQNCLQKEALNLQCKICKDGYELIDQQCIETNQDSGCFEKNQYDQCVTCKFGFYQEIPGLCIKNQINYSNFYFLIKLFLIFFIYKITDFINFVLAFIIINLIIILILQIRQCLK